MKTLQVQVHSGKVLLDTVEVVVPETYEEVVEKFKPEVIVGVIQDALVTKARNNRRADVQKVAMNDPAVKAAIVKARKAALAKITG